MAYANKVKLFGRWTYDDVKADDIAVEDFIAVKAKDQAYVPHTGGRYQVKRFRKAQCPIVERLVNALMRKGRNNGKKLLAVRVVQQALEIVHLLTDENPLQVRGWNPPFFFAECVCGSQGRFLLGLRERLTYPLAESLRSVHG